MFDVELTTLCNKKCYCCPREKLTRTNRKMSKTTFDALCEWLPTDCDVFFAGFGEPLMHESCADFVKELHDSGRGTSIMTNGILLNEKMCGNLFGAGLDKLQVSIIQKTDLESITRFTEMIPREFRSCTVFNIIKEEEMENPDERIAEFLGDGWKFCAKQVHNRAGMLFPSAKSHELKTCATFFCDTYISADGEIQICSNDINGTNNIGTIFDMSFEELLLHKKRFFGNRQICPMCENCTDEYRLKHFLEKL